MPTNVMAWEQDHQQCTESDFGHILREFFEQLDYRLPLFQPRDAVIEQVSQYFESLDWDAGLAERTSVIASWVCHGTIYSYPFLVDDALKHVCIFTTYLFIFDDYGAELASHLRSFASNLLRRLPQPHEVLRSFVDFVPCMRAHFGLFANDVFLTTTIDFFNGCLLEHQLDSSAQLDTHGAISFPRYFRLKTGYAEPYAHFIFPESNLPESETLSTYLPYLPDLVDFINGSNDLLSFYKESILGSERNNFIYNEARAQQLEPRVALQALSTELIDIISRISKGLSRNEVAAIHADTFINGFLAYHITAPRYKLNRVMDLDRLRNGCLKTDTTRHRPGLHNRTDSVLGDSASNATSLHYCSASDV